MVLRSIPVTRSIWRWLVLDSSRVDIVVCRCGFKTFNPVSLKSEGVKVTSCLVLTEAVKQRCLAHRHAALRVGEFEVATSGGIWVAIRGQHTKIAMPVGARWWIQGCNAINLLQRREV